MRTGHPAVDVALPITPMLDMSFQLLSFFILTFHPMPTEGQLAVTLPPAAGVQISLPDPPADFVRDEYTITVTEFAGQLSIGLRGPSAVLPDLKSLADLRDALADLPRRENVAITVEAAADLPYARLIAVLDVCRKTGIEAINITAVRSRPA